MFHVRLRFRETVCNDAHASFFQGHSCVIKVYACVAREEHVFEFILISMKLPCTFQKRPK